MQDIDGAVNFVKSLGYKHIYLIGSSTGANKIAIYNKYKPENEVEKYILECGGDDSGIYYSSVTKAKFEMVLKKCKQMIHKGRGRELVPKYIMNYAISYQSLFDQIDPEGDYNTFPFYWSLNNIKIMKKKAFGEVEQIDKPTLVIYGSEDEYCYGRVSDCMNLIRNTIKGKNNFEFEIIPGADHGFTNHWQELADSVAKFLET